MDGAGTLVFRPATSCDVAAYDGLDRQNFGSFDQHGSTLDLVLETSQLLLELFGEVRIVGSDDVGLDERGSQKTKPKGGERVEKFSFVGDAVLKDDIEGRYPIGGDKEDGTGMRTVGKTCIVHITNLSLCDKFEGQIGGYNCVARHLRAAPFRGSILRVWTLLMMDGVGVESKIATQEETERIVNRFGVQGGATETCVASHLYDL